MRTPQGKVATAYFAKSGQMLSEIANILGEKEDAEHFAEVAAKAKEAFRFIATENGVIKSDRQAEYIRAITFDLLSEDEKDAAAGQLNDLVVANDYHLNTGFLSTPDLCAVLADYGYEDTASRVLLQDTMPGWLYSVKKGATTIWEAWNGIDENGIPHESLNHYSKGAIVEWLISGVCGIKVNGTNVRVEPKPLKALGNIKAFYDSPVGRIGVEIVYDNGEPKVTVKVPANVQAEIVC